MNISENLKSEPLAAATRLTADITAAAGRYILGKDAQVRLALCCLLAEGHLLIEDLPGMGKTTLMNCIAGKVPVDSGTIIWHEAGAPPRDLGSYPVVDWKDAVNNMEDTRRSTLPHVTTSVICSDDSYWLVAKGESMNAPQGLSIPAGTMILVDPHAPPRAPGPL